MHMTCSPLSVLVRLVLLQNPFLPFLAHIVDIQVKSPISSAQMSILVGLKRWLAVINLNVEDTFLILVKEKGGRPRRGVHAVSLVCTLLILELEYIYNKMVVVGGNERLAASH